jgi:hypothetical protein
LQRRRASAGGQEKGVHVPQDAHHLLDQSDASHVVADLALDLPAGTLRLEQN